MTERMQTLVMDSSPDLEPSACIISMSNLQLLPKCMELALKYHIADALPSSQGPHRIGDLAKTLNLNEQNLKRILALLASFEIFQQADNDEDIFLGNERSDLLRSDSPIYNTVVHLSSRQIHLAMMELNSCLSTGEPSFELANGSPIYHYMTMRPEYQATFDASMTELSGKAHAYLSEHYDFSPYRIVCDIGGGRGGLLLDILSKFKAVRGMLFERAAVIPNIICDLHSADALKHRFQAVVGDAIFGIDVDADLYIVSNMLIDFEDSDVMTILINIGRAMNRQRPRTARFLLLEPNAGAVFPNEPSLMKRGLDLLMMVATGGQARSTARWLEILRQCEMTVLQTFEVPPQSIAYECELLPTPEETILYSSKA